MDEDAIWACVEEQRLGMADLLAGLDEAQWEAPSLCDGWRVRDVAAHLTIAPLLTVPELVTGLLRARGSFNRFVLDDARRRAQASPEEIVAALRRVASSRRHPAPTKPIDPLVDVLVHGQDIAVPLGIDRAVPTDAAVAAADHVWGSGFPFRARARLAGHRLVATDATWSAGDGTPVEAPIQRLLLLLTGRLTPALAASG